MVVVLPEPLTPTIEDDERLFCRVDRKRLRDARQHLLDLSRRNALDLVRRNRRLVAAFAQSCGDAAGRFKAEIGADQHILDVGERRRIELALGNEIEWPRPAPRSCA